MNKQDIWLIEKNIKTIKKEVSWLISNITPVSGELWEAIKICENLINNRRYK